MLKYKRPKLQSPICKHFLRICLYLFKSWYHGLHEVSSLGGLHVPVHTRNTIPVLGGRL